VSSSETDLRIKQILTRRLGVSPDEISADASLVDELGLDSVDLVELTIALEQQFGLTLEDDDVREARTIRDVAAIVERLQSGAHSEAVSDPRPRA